MAMTRCERLAHARDQVVEIVHRVWPYVLIEVDIGAVIHNRTPVGSLTNILLVEGDPPANIAVIKDPEKNFGVISKDGRKFRDDLPAR